MDPRPSYQEESPLRRRRRSDGWRRRSDEDDVAYQRRSPDRRYERPRRRSRSLSPSPARSNDSDRRRRKRRRKRNRSRSPRRKDRHDDRDRRSRRRRRRDRSSSSASEQHSPPEATPRRGVVSVDDDAGRNRGTAKKYSKRSPSPHDDTVGHFRGPNGTVIADRYKTIRQVGIGTFGRVIECLDLKARGRAPRDNVVALKIVRNVKRYYDSALIEARVVDDVNRRGGRGVSHCVVMYKSFTFGGHYCMVFESLGPSLYDFLKRHKYRPFPMACIQDFTVQLLETLEFLHSFRLIHTDLKIENILLMNDREVTFNGQRVPESTRIKVIDFGGACYDHEKKSSTINTRQYRAPEVILSTGWSMPSDMWSIGCILAELYQGELLFATHDNLEHLALIERIIGPFPRDMLKKARSSSPLASEAFDSRGMHRVDGILPSESAAFVTSARPLGAIINKPEDSWFLDLLRRILVIDPRDRSTAHECLQHLSRIRRDVVRFN